MKTLYVIVLILLSASAAHGQGALTLEECYDLAESQYPLIRQRKLIQMSGEYAVTNASKASLPRVSFAGQASYQSEVTQIPVEMPGVVPLSKDQYRAAVDVSQTLYDGRATARNKQLEALNAAVEQENLDLELYRVRSRVSDLFFGILLLEAQGALTRLVRADLEAALVEVEALIDNGVAIPSARSEMEAEILKMDQRLIEIKASLDSYREMLGLFIGRRVDASTGLERPVFDVNVKDDVLRRPELELFRLQRQSLQARESLLSVKRTPRIELFAQIGYGRPGLNMLRNEFDFFYIGGLRVSWLISAYYNARREKELLRIGQQSIQVREDSFRFNTRLELVHERSNIEKLRRLIDIDRNLITLKTKIRQTAHVQLKEGIIGPADFVREANAEDQAKQSLALHQTQLLQAQGKYLLTSGY